MTSTRPEPLTDDELFRRRWYVVQDDEVGGWAIATVNRPTSEIDPMTTRDRVLAEFVWEEHARWVCAVHNAVVDAPVLNPVTGTVAEHVLTPEECG